MREILRASKTETNLLLEQLSKREIPSLYGLRGIAALVVVLYHYCLEWKVADFPGYYSVTLFFELSGLLITWLMLKEIDVSGAVDRRQFYIRRSLRLFPVFYVVWIVCRMAGPFAGSWAYFFYLGDYYTALTGKYSLLTSAWSLGVEEKFYLIWPQLVVRVSLARLTKILILVLVLEPIYRWVLTRAGYDYYTHFAFETNLDPIVLGCLIAIGVKQRWGPPRWLIHPVTVLSAIGLGVLCWRSADVVTYVLGIALIYLICRPPWVLNNAVVRFFGLISYSLYLCHEYMADVVAPFFFHLLPKLPSYLGITVEMLLAIAGGTALHYAVERPFLRLKNRFHSRASLKMVAD